MTHHAEELGSRSQAHPSEADWERLMMDELTDPERESLMDHVASCGECAPILRALHDVEAGAAELDPDAPPAVLVAPKTPTWRSRLLVGGSLAAAALLALIGAWPFLSTGDGKVPLQDTPLLRSGPVPDSVLVLQAPLEQVAETRPTFAWSEVPGASAYRIELLDDLGELLWTGDSESSSMPWPRDVRSAMGLYYWRVSAVLESGGTVVSPLRSFEIIPPGS